MFVPVMFPFRRNHIRSPSTIRPLPRINHPHTRYSQPRHATWDQLMLQWILATPSPFQKSEFKFHWTPGAASHNWSILETYQLDHHRALLGQAGSSLTFGSELRSIELLQPLLQDHPLWPRLQRWLTQGEAILRFPLRPLPASCGRFA